MTASTAPTSSLTTPRIFHASRIKSAFPVLTIDPTTMSTLVKMDLELLFQETWITLSQVEENRQAGRLLTTVDTRDCKFFLSSGHVFSEFSVFSNRQYQLLRAREGNIQDAVRLRRNMFGHLDHTRYLEVIKPPSNSPFLREAPSPQTYPPWKVPVPPPQSNQGMQPRPAPQEVEEGNRWEAVTGLHIIPS